MKYNFAHQTLGYVKDSNENIPENLTNNSKALIAIRSKIKNNIKVTGFTQKIPRIGYFNELILFEQSDASSQIIKYQNQLEQEIRSNECSTELLELALRSGLSKVVIEKTKNLNAEFKNIALLYIKDFAELQYAYENSLPITTNNLEKLFQVAVKNDSPIMAATIACRIIVKSARYTKSIVTNYIDYTKYLFEFLCNQRSESMDTPKRALLWRGLAMSPLLPESQILACVNNSLNLIEQLDDAEELQSLLKLDLKLTTLLTLAKTHSKMGNATEELNVLNEIIKLDEYESSSWSELGFYWYRNKLYQKALIAFNAAFNLGPPALSMHAFFIAKCHTHLNANKEEVLYWLECSRKYDALAISPLIDLAHIYKIINHQEYIKIKNEIYQNVLLLEQLSADERNWFEKL